MKLIGFNFTKFDLEKKSDNLKDLKISTEINIIDIKESKSNFFNTSDTLILVKFEYIINYEKNIANLKFYGNLLISLGKEQVIEVLNQWNNKTLPVEFKVNLFNLILRKSSAKALQFEEDLNLPSHIPLPSFKKKKQ